MKKIFLIFSVYLSLILLIQLPFVASAEIAVLCGDLSKIAHNEKNAELHTVFSNQRVRSKKDVKFLLIFGMEQTVVQSKNIYNKLSVKTANQSYIFDKLSNLHCDGETKFSVRMLKNKKLNCLCFED